MSDQTPGAWIPDLINLIAVCIGSNLLKAALFTVAAVLTARWMGVDI